VTRKSSHRAADGRKSTIAQCSGPEPTWATAAGYSYIAADSETDMLLALRGGLQAQLADLEDYIVERLESKLAARRS
jgi:hypothetical protein